MKTRDSTLYGEFDFTFGFYKSRVIIQEELPEQDEITGSCQSLVICDTNTEFLARRIFTNPEIKFCILESGEKSKTWAGIEKILKCALEINLDRNGLFIGLGGGVIGDLTAFAASIYKRGIRVRLVSTTLLGMVDASIGGKTGIDLFGIKNLAGTFYPAELVFMPVSSLESLPETEWKSGMAELIKTAILSDTKFLQLTKTLKKTGQNPGTAIAWAVEFKGRLVEKDPRETGSSRILLNLGHTFGHALESTLGLGTISHGEAVAWGIARACDLGQILGITDREWSAEILDILHAHDFDTAPLPGINTEKFMEAMTFDKKNKSGKINFIIPARQGAQIASSQKFPVLGEPEGSKLIKKIISMRSGGEFGK